MGSRKYVHDTTIDIEYLTHTFPVYKLIGYYLLVLLSMPENLILASLRSYSLIRVDGFPLWRIVISIHYVKPFALLNSSTISFVAFTISTHPGESEWQHNDIW